jgi:outer membrane protein
MKEFPIHMKRIFALAVLLASGLTLNAVAQSSVPAAPAPAPSAAAPAAPAAPIVPVPAKVAVIAFNAVVASTNEGQRDLADVQRKFQPKQEQLKTLNDEIENLKKQLQAQGEKLAPAEAAARAKTIDDKTKQLQRTAEDDRNDYQQEMGETLNTLASKVYDVLEGYAKERGFTMVVDMGTQQQSPVVLWASESTDISKAILDAYNTKSGVPSPPAQPAAAATPKPAPRRAPTAAPAAPQK